MPEELLACKHKWNTQLPVHSHQGPGVDQSASCWGPKLADRFCAKTYWNSVELGLSCAQAMSPAGFPPLLGSSHLENGTHTSTPSHTHVHACFVLLCILLPLGNPSHSRDADCFVTWRLDLGYLMVAASSIVSPYIYKFRVPVTGNCRMSIV